MSKTKKKKKATVQKRVVQKKVAESSLDKLVSQDFSLVALGIIILLISLIHFGYSYLSNGFYQGEEGIHYMNMKKFWNNPNAILGNWGKPGWKLVVVIPALLGFKFLAFFNSFVAALAGWVAYKVAQLKGVKIPILAFVLLAGQFFWMEMAFRNYSEFITATLLIGAVYAHLKDKLILACLFLSYTLIMRQELLPVAGLYALYLLYKKRAWVPVALIAVFPLLINLWGAIVTGDPLYSLTNALNVSSSAADLYPRHGFDHYYKVALPIYGPFILVGFLTYLGLVFTKKRKLDYFVFFPFAILFTIYCLFNLQTVKIGTSTAGNWRYLLLFSPMMAIMATIGWDALWQTKKKWHFLVLLIPYLIYAIVFDSYEHNYVGFSDVKNWILPGTLATAIGLAMLPISRGPMVISIAALSVLFNYLYLKPIKMVGEDAKMKEIAAWVKQENIEDNPIYYSNKMLNVFMNKNPHELENGMYVYTKVEELEAAPVGSHIFWDTHYSKRTSKVDYTYFQTRQDLYQIIKQEQSDDKRYAILIFKKIK